MAVLGAAALIAMVAVTGVSAATPTPTNTVVAATSVPSTATPAAPTATPTEDLSTPTPPLYRKGLTPVLPVTPTSQAAPALPATGTGGGTHGHAAYIVLALVASLGGAALVARGAMR
jgi:hypothetical protein